MTRLTREALLDKLDAEIAWRRIELSALRTTLDTASGTATYSAARSAVALAYAHWEGYVITACRLLVGYVRDLRLRYSDLADSYVALCLAGQLTLAESSSRRIQRHIDVIVQLRTDHERATFPSPEKMIYSEGNLKSDKFADLIARLGLDSSVFELQYNWLDGELLRRRNAIAHGEGGYTDVVFAHDALGRVTGLLDAFRTAAQNAVVLEVFKREDSAQRSTVPA